MQKLIGALFLTAMMAVTALPANAATTENYTWAVQLDGLTGKVTVVPADQIHTDGFARCSGLAPLVNSCTTPALANFCGACFGALVYYSPPIAPAPVGSAPELSHHITFAATDGMRATWDISLIQPVTPNGIGIPLPPFVLSSFSFQSIGSFSRGTTVMTDHVGLWNPHAAPFIGGSLPDTNSVEAGVGNWASELYT